MARKKKPAAKKRDIRAQVLFNKIEHDAAQPAFQEVETRLTEQNEEEPSQSDVWRELVLQGAAKVLNDAVKKGNIQRVKTPEKTARTLPLIRGISCGGPECVTDALSDADEVVVTDPEALQFVTENSWVGVADGWSMHDSEYPDSISEGDQLLLVPIEEWKKRIPSGTAMLFYLELKDGTQGLSLKEYYGSMIYPRNPNFDKIDFFPGGDVKFGQPLAICVYRFGKSLV